MSDWQKEGKALIKAMDNRRDDFLIFIARSLEDDRLEDDDRQEEKWSDISDDSDAFSAFVDVVDATLDLLPFDKYRIFDEDYRDILSILVEYER